MTEPEPTLEQADSPERVATARALFREYAQAIGTDLEYQGFTAELAALPARLTCRRVARCSLRESNPASPAASRFDRSTRVAAK